MMHVMKLMVGVNQNLMTVNGQMYLYVVARVEL